ncbi:MAG: isopenicillin N synthase family dioxygenase [Myxococcota bacterium]
MHEVPTVDIASPDSASLSALDAACRDHGFFLLAGHGLEATIGRTWDQTRRFFAASRAVKGAVLRTERNGLGYYDRELTKRRRDHKEVFDFMAPREVGGLDRTPWPADLPGFRDELVSFFEAASGLAARTLRLVQAALGLSEGVSARHLGSPLTSTVRLNHYPVGDPVPRGERDGLPALGEVALGHHTDPGVLTLLLQDGTGGLQALSPADGWLDVPPRAGTVVVNLADTLQVWTNDRYRAAVHRVVPMTRAARYSIPYFFNPALDAVIEPIAELAGGAPRYRPFTWREFIRARIDDNYADRGVEDTQASHFRID